MGIHQSGWNEGAVAPSLRTAAEHHNTDDPGQRLKRIRERLNLRYRDVEEASQKIAQRHANDEFAIALSRLADIENKGTVPTLYRVYSLCAIYRLDPMEVLQWYGIDVSQLAADAAQIEVERSHVIGFPTGGNGVVQIPLALDPGVDLRKTTHLSRFIQRWGTLPVMLLQGLDLKNHRYAFLGTEDWAMYPILQPGSLLVIDEARRRPVQSGWTTEFERPIYFFEHRDGFECAWCAQDDDELILQYHPASGKAPQVFEFSSSRTEVDIIGQVTGVAMRLDSGRRRRTRS